MGGFFSSLWTKIWASEKEYKVVLIGLNNAGKTTTLYKLVLNEVVVTAPTIGSNVEEVTHKNIKYVMWDLGGQTTSRPTWPLYFSSTDAVILVVDSTDRDRIQLVSEELDKILHSDLLEGAVLLIFANKQDVKTAMSAVEISEHLSLHEIKKREWHIQPCCALTGEGLIQGLDWLGQRLQHIGSPTLVPGSPSSSSSSSSAPAISPSSRAH